MLDRVLDDGLKNHAWNQTVERFAVDVFLKLQLLPKSHHLDPQVVVDKRDFVA